MKKKLAIQFLKLLGVPESSMSTMSSGWVRCSCPLAPWTHDSGKDSKPSFGVKVEDTGDSYYNCYTCGGGDLLQLLYTLSGNGVKPPKYKIKEALALVESQWLDASGEFALHIKDYEDPVQEALEVVYFPDIFLEQYPKVHDVPRAVEYLKSRRVTSKLAHEFDLRYDLYRDAIIFPQLDMEGYLVGARSRRISPPPDCPKYHVYKSDTGQHNKCHWFNEDKLDFAKPVLMVESVFDVLSVCPVYSNVLAPLTVGISNSQLHRVSELMDIVTLFDNGKGGDRARETVSKFFNSAYIAHLNPPQPYGDPGDMPREAVHELLCEHLPLNAILGA